jgi:hypothetical protein
MTTELEKLGGQTDATILEKTGKTWSEWVSVLDGIGAQTMAHPEIAKWVNAQINDGWWAQTVTVGYERIRGLRDVGQSRAGEYEASKSKTVKAAAKDVFEAILALSEDAVWLNGLTLAGSTPHKSVRFQGEDTSRAAIWISASGDAKTSLSVSHTKLDSKDRVNDVKKEWGDRFDILSKHVVGG